MAKEQKPGIGADLGAELRKKREAAGIRSQQEMGDRLHCDRTLITKIESGKTVPTDQMVAAWGEECDFDPTPYLVMARHARRPEISFRYFESWLELEKIAKLFRIWCPLLVTGALQTEDYARTVFESEVTDQDTIDGFLAIRLGRREVYAAARSIILIDESVLYRMIGSPAIMADQLQHILDVSDGLGLSVQVVPSARATCGLSGAFIIASGGEFPDTVCMEAVADQITDRPSTVERAATKFDLLRGYAQSRDQSRETITEAIGKWRAQV